MFKYNYHFAVKQDVLSYIEENINFSDFGTLEELEQHLNDELWTVDSVTGNASGSYYCNAWRAEEAIAHNWDLLEEALQEFGGLSEAISKGAEWCDVSIRCYLLGECIAAALEEIEEDFEAAHEGEEVEG